MRNILFLFIFLSSKTQAADITINQVRMYFHASATNENSCLKLTNILEEYNELNNPTMAAYRACATMMMARYVLNPINKLSYFNQGKNLLEKCIKVDNANIEIHYLRFTIQSNAPTFLGYYNSISNDKLFLLKNISNVNDLQLKHMIISFLKSSKHLTIKEKQNFK